MRRLTEAPTGKRLIAAAYDESAAAFAVAADRLVYRYLARPLVDAIGPGDGRFLDVAAGAGAAGCHFPGAVALELSMGQLRHNPAARRVQADAERLPFRDGSFAAAVCAFGINHFPDPHAAVSEMARVASLDAAVEPVMVLVPWPGIEAFLDYRLSMASAAGLVSDTAALRRDAAAALAALPEHQLDWHAALIVGVGRRR